MFKDAKKDAQQWQLSNVWINSYKTNLYTYHKSKRGLLQWVLILTHGNNKKMNV